MATTISVYLYYCVFALLPLLLAISYKNVASVLPLLFILLALLTVKRPDTHSLKNPAAYFLLIFIIYACVSSVWAIAPYEALERCAKIMVLLLPVLYLLYSDNFNKKININIAIGLTLVCYLAASGLIFWQQCKGFLIKDLLLTSSGISRTYASLNPAVTGFAILYWPILALLESSSLHRQKKNVAFLFLTAVLLLLLYAGHTDTAWVASACGAVFYFWVRSGGAVSLMKFFVLTSIILVTLLPPYLYKKIPEEGLVLDSDNAVLVKVLERSHLHRIEIWDRSIELALERPLFGWGMAGSYNLPKTEQRSRVDLNTFRSEFLYPHNIFIQCLVDFGALGLLLLLLWINALFNWIGQLSQPVRAYCAASTIAVITVYSFGFPLWRGWWIVLLCVLAIYWKLLISFNGPGNSSLETENQSK